MAYLSSVRWVETACDRMRRGKDVGEVVGIDEASCWDVPGWGRLVGKLNRQAWDQRRG